MEVVGRTVVVTGGASGIGAALVQGFKAQGADVWVLDMAREAARDPDRYLMCDVTDASALGTALDKVCSVSGEVDIYVSNAGVMSRDLGDIERSSIADWERCWSVNVMAHVHAVQAVLPAMRSRGCGHFVIVASAAGLLNQIGDAAYSATKHAAVSFADSLAIEHGDDGIGVSLVCPQYVATPLIGLTEEDAKQASGLLTATQVADCVLAAVADDRFLVLPHPEVAGYAGLRAQDHDRWINGMRKLRQRAERETGSIDPTEFYKLV